MDQLSAADAARLRQEFDIPLERKDAFDRFITELEADWETEEVMNRPVGKARLRRIRATENHLTAILDEIHRSMTTPSSIDEFFRSTSEVPTIEPDGTLDLYALYKRYDSPMPATDDAPAPTAEVQRAAVDYLNLHYPALVHHALRSKLDSLRLTQDFCADNMPKPRGRPADKSRRMLLDLLLRRHTTFLDFQPSYADGHPFVRFCERLLEAYGIETGDTAQLIKRALGRGKRAVKARGGHDEDLNPFP